MSDRIRDSLDDAIDRVAAGLVCVKEDPLGAERIIASLPTRQAHGWWSLSSLPLQAVVLASIVLVVVYVRSSREDEWRADEASRPIASLDTKPMGGFAELRAAALREPTTVDSSPLAVRRPRVANERLSSPFELAAIAAPEQLTVRTLQTPTPLAAVEPASIVPIVLRELPLADDVPPPFSKE